jgi:hypothetical protein
MAVELMIKTSELIELLQESLEENGDLPVMVDGYEGGFNPLKEDKINTQTLTFNPSPHCGLYDTAWEDEDEHAFDALILPRR